MARDLAQHFLKDLCLGLGIGQRMVRARRRLAGQAVSQQAELGPDGLPERPATTRPAETERRSLVAESQAQSLSQVEAAHAKDDMLIAGFETLEIKYVNASWLPSISRPPAAGSGVMIRNGIAGSILVLTEGHV